MRVAKSMQIGICLYLKILSIIFHRANFIVLFFNLLLLFISVIFEKCFVCSNKKYVKNEFHPLHLYSFKLYSIKSQFTLILILGQTQRMLKIVGGLNSLVALLSRQIESRDNDDYITSVILQTISSGLTHYGIY